MLTSTTTKKRRWIAYAHEVRAILDGRQSQFRRPVSPVPEWQEQPQAHPKDRALWCGRHQVDEGHGNIGVEVHEQRCPFGKPGDVLHKRDRSQSRATVDRGVIVATMDGAMSASSAASRICNQGESPMSKNRDRNIAAGFVIVAAVAYMASAGLQYLINVDRREQIQELRQRIEKLEASQEELPR